MQKLVDFVDLANDHAEVGPCGDGKSMWKWKKDGKYSGLSIHFKSVSLLLFSEYVCLVHPHTSSNNLNISLKKLGFSILKNM